MPLQPPAISPVFSECMPVPKGTSTKRPVDRLMELRLWHHFTSNTYKTLIANSDSTGTVWLHDVPHIAFAGKPYLTDALLAVAALHLRSIHPEEKALVYACHAYSANALEEYGLSLNNGITADNAEALFLTSALIAFHASASRLFIKDDGDATPVPGSTKSSYTLPLAWFHAFQGVKTVVSLSWQWIRNSAAVKMVIESQPGFQLNMNPLGGESFFAHLLDGVAEEVADEDQREAAYSSQAYSHAVSVLNWAHKNPYPPAALAFPATVSKRFVELVTEKKPRALAILACFFALLKRMEPVWWLGDVSRREVMGIIGLFEPGSKWWKHLEWPVRIALLDDGPIPANVWGTECEVRPEGDKGLMETMMSHIELLAKMGNAVPASPASPPASVTDELGYEEVPLD